jgi:hypothetical protein
MGRDFMEIGNSMKCETVQPRTSLGNNGSKLHWLVAVYDHNGEPSQAKLELAKAEYKRRYPWCRGDNTFNVIWVVSQKHKLRMERILAGKVF